MDAPSSPLADSAPPSPPPPGKRSLLLFSLLALLLVIGAVELMSAAVFLVAEGRLFSYAEQERRRSRITGRENELQTQAEEEGLEALIGPRNMDVFAFREVLHPFLGFVFNPQLNELEQRRERRQLIISPMGFFERPGSANDAGPEPRADVEVGIFGGSVAMMFCFQAQDELLSALSELPRLRDQRIGITCYALGGYKQPQQLMTLSYLLALGRPLDLAINLDGFNEMALSYFDNYSQGVTPHYPRGWKERVDDFSNRQVQWLLGHSVFLRRQRAALAEAFSARPWSWSVTANLVWRLLDRRLAADLVVAQREAADFVPTEQSYEWQGPFEEKEDRGQVFARQAEIWHNSSLQMHRLAAANGVGYFHFLQPNQYLPESKPMGRQEKERSVDSGSSYLWLVPESYPLLQEQGRRLRDEGVAFHDLSQVFANVDEPLYVDNCCHLNRWGSRRLARAVVDRLRPSSWANGASDPPSGAPLAAENR